VHSFVDHFKSSLSESSGTFNRNTIRRLDLRLTGNSECSNSIITDVIDFEAGDLNYYFTLRNSIIRKSLEWQWKQSPIPSYWTEAGNEIEDVKASLYTYASETLTVPAETEYLKRMADNLFGEGTIIYDDENADIKLFAGYDGNGNITDYSLNLQNGNPALFISDTMSYVGCYRPKIGISFKPSIEIDENGDPTGNEGDLLQNNMGIFFNIDSVQNRNRMETEVVAMANGDRFTKFQSTFFPSSSGSFYLGPKQDLATENLHAIDAVLIEPYDDPETASAFPKFPAPINEDVKIAYFSTGAKAGSPVLFGDLAGLGISTNKNPNEAGAWAVTNACDEWDNVVGLASVSPREARIRYFKLVLLGNRV
jgi:hypothetical protein